MVIHALSQHSPFQWGILNSFCTSRDREEQMNSLDFRQLFKPQRIWMSRLVSACTYEVGLSRKRLIVEGNVFRHFIQTGPSAKMTVSWKKHVFGLREKSTTRISFISNFVFPHCRLDYPKCDGYLLEHQSSRRFLHYRFWICSLVSGARVRPDHLSFGPGSSQRKRSRGCSRGSYHQSGMCIAPVGHAKRVPQLNRGKLSHTLIISGPTFY